MGDVRIGKGLLATKVDESAMRRHDWLLSVKILLRQHASSRASVGTGARRAILGTHPPIYNFSSPGTLDRLMWTSGVGRPAREISVIRARCLRWSDLGPLLDSVMGARTHRSLRQEESGVKSVWVRGQLASALSVKAASAFMQAPSGLVTKPAS